MKSRILYTAFIALSTCPGLMADGPTSKVRQVELYPSGAAVTREVVIAAADSGEMEVEIVDLPSNLLPSSIQIAATGQQSLRIGGFSFLPRENPVEEEDPRTKELRDQIDSITDHLRELKQESELIQSRKVAYGDLADSVRKSLEEEATAQTYELARQAWGDVEKVSSDGNKRLAVLAREEKASLQARKELQEELNERVAELNARAGVLRFDLAGDLSGETRLLLRYSVREAGWNPVYEIRANPASGKLTWIYKARIWQNTGEDWIDAQASLNSASALTAGGLPELRPWILRRMEIRPMASRGRVADEVYQLSAFEAKAEMEMPAEAASPESTTTGFFINMPDPLSVESGEGPVVREAFTGELQADFWSEAVPELSTEAWLMAGCTNELGWPILPGEGYCYIDGQLVARRGIQGFSAGEEMELALGRNEKISIERKERLRKESEGGLIDKTKRHEFKYETTVENGMRTAHRVVLQDRFPIGRDNKVQVKVASPKDVEPEEGTNIFKWERTIEAGATAVMTTEYTITYPAEWSINIPE